MGEACLAGPEEVGGGGGEDCCSSTKVAAAGGAGDPEVWQEVGLAPDDAGSSSGQVPLVHGRRQPLCCCWQAVRHHLPHWARSSRYSGLPTWWGAFRCSSWIYVINFVHVNGPYYVGQLLPILDIHPRTSNVWMPITLEAMLEMMTLVVDE